MEFFFSNFVAFWEYPNFNKNNKRYFSKINSNCCLNKSLKGKRKIKMTRLRHECTKHPQNGRQIGQKFRQKFCQNYWAKNILHTSIKWIFYSLFPYYFQTFQKDFAPILLGTFEHEKVGKKKSHLSVEEVTVEFQALQTTIHVQKALK